MVVSAIPYARELGRAGRVVGALVGLLLLPAYDFVRDGDGRRFSFPDREIAVFVLAPSGNQVPTEELSEATRAAVERWREASGDRLRLVYGGLVARAPGFDVTVGIRSTDTDAADGELIGDVSYVGSGGVLQRVEVTLDAAQWAFVAPSSASDPRPRADLRASVVHLLGHAVGLAHSRELAATMGFLPIEPGKRSLEGDDIAGVRALYGDSAAGGLCDGCEGDGDCGGGGRCLRWPDGRASCAAGCVVHADCPVGWSCGLWSGGQACLPNGGHCSPDRETARASGPCASDLACPSPLQCLVLEDRGMCTAGCAGNCGSFGQCVQVQLGGTVLGICLDLKQRPFGGRCEAAADCKSLLCLPSIDGGGFCSAPCAAGCPSGATCDGAGACVAKGLGPDGWPCGSGFDCGSGRCVGQGSERRCAQPCSLASDCAKGSGCAKPAGQSGTFCLPFGTPGPGAPCTGACSGGATCVAETTAVRVCRIGCDPFIAADSCPEGSKCVYRGGSGHCRPGKAGSNIGDPCGPGNACLVDLVCAERDGVATCLADCELASGAPCAAGQTCAKLLGDDAGTGPARGVCALDGAARQIRSTAPESSANFAARTLTMPKVVAWAPIPEPEPPPTDSGCQSAASLRAGRSAWPPWALGALIVGIFLCRSRHAGLGGLGPRAGAAARSSAPGP